MYVCCVLSARVEHLEAAGGSTVASSCMTQTHFLWETDKCKSSNESTHWLRFAIKTQTNEQKQWRNTLSTFLFILLNRQYICRIKQVSTLNLIWMASKRCHLKFLMPDWLNTRFSVSIQAILTLFMLFQIVEMNLLSC